MDIVIIGAGPAGCAAAITAARAGLRVILLEGQRFPRHRPGESLHPGVEPIFRQLGVWNEIEAAHFIRHPGHRVLWQGAAEYSAFGGTEADPWLGFQAWRPTLDAILLHRVASLGVEVLQPCLARSPIIEDGRLAGIVAERGDLRARFTIDASGSRGWLSRRLDQPRMGQSSTLVASYGYVETRGAAQWFVPELASFQGGWTWVAQVLPTLIAWTCLSFEGRRLGPPLPLAGLPDARRFPVGRSAADVTWRLASQPAGPGYFLAGDAAISLDPASAHGVLRALMSGIMAAHLITQVFRSGLAETSAASTYRNWVDDWFSHDARNLESLYRRLSSPPKWLSSSGVSSISSLLPLR